MLSNEKTAQLNATLGPKPPGNHPVVGCLDVETDRVIWERYLYEFPEAKGRKLGAGQAAITPDGRKLYVPPEWTGGNETTVLDASNGNLIAFVPTGGNGCGNAMMSPDGKFAYASGGWSKISTETDTLVLDSASGRPLAFPRRSSHFMINATGDRMFLTCDGIKKKEEGGAPAIICSTADGAVLATPRVTADPPLGYFRLAQLSHEISFTPCGRYVWTQAMAEWFKEAPPPELFQHPQVVDNPEPKNGSIKWVSEWDIATDPPALVRMIATRSNGHSHAHALVTREGDLLLTGNGYALDTATGKIKHSWRNKDGKWFQGTKFMQVNFRDGKVDWVGQRHGTGWLYKVPALSAKTAEQGSQP
jgi:DNA-binding beta-propeller fold protein YncE